MNDMNDYESIKQYLLNYKSEGTLSDLSEGDLIADIISQLLDGLGNIPVLNDQEPFHERFDKERDHEQDSNIEPKIPQCNIDLTAPVDIDILLKKISKRKKDKYTIVLRDIYDVDDGQIVYPKKEDEDNEDEFILGWYEPMHSPGRIVFCVDNITKAAVCLFNNLIYSSKVNNSIGLLIFSLLLIFEDVRIHESFHYYCDVKRTLLGSIFNRNLEEALAVAHSYNNIDFTLKKDSLKQTFRRTKLENAVNHFCNSVTCSKINANINQIKLEWYNGFSLPGYKDWSKYNNYSHYEKEYFDYLKDTRSLCNILRSNGVDILNVPVESYLLGMEGTQTFLYYNHKFIQTKIGHAKNGDKYDITFIQSKLCPNSINLPKRKYTVTYHTSPIAANCSLGRAVWEVVNHYATHLHPGITLANLQKAFAGINTFPKPWICDWGGAITYNTTNTHKRYFDKPTDQIPIAGGHATVSTQWYGTIGQNFDEFCRVASALGYSII